MLTEPQLQQFERDSFLRVARVIDLEVVLAPVEPEYQELLHQLARGGCKALTFIDAPAQCEKVRVGKYYRLA